MHAANSLRGNCFRGGWYDICNHFMLIGCYIRRQDGYIPQAGEKDRADEGRSGSR